jgi:hypothetical protein
MIRDGQGVNPGFADHVKPLARYASLCCMLLAYLPEWVGVNGQTDISVFCVPLQGRRRKRNKTDSVTTNFESMRLMVTPNGIPSEMWHLDQNQTLT